MFKPEKCTLNSTRKRKKPTDYCIDFNLILYLTVFINYTTSTNNLNPHLFYISFSEYKCCDFECSTDSTGMFIVVYTLLI
jgi:hypothetical protein